MSRGKKTVLVLDGGHKKTLAIVRALGKDSKIRVDVAASSKKAISFFSKYTGHKIVLPNPKTEGERFKNALLKVLKIKPYLTVIPTDYYSFYHCAEIQDQIQKYSHIIIASPELILHAGNKFSINKLATSLGIPVPQSEICTVSNYKNITLNENTTYVLKTNQESGNNLLKYFQDRTQVKLFLNQFFTKNPKEKLVIQERIIGKGFGFFAFYKNGECISHFTHQRIREYPPKGGYSVAAKGSRAPEVYQQGKRILDHLKWNGVAMVEFKYDTKRKEYALLEINPKFWGSLDLSITNGRNFAQYWVDDALGKLSVPQNDYSLQKFQWILNGELFHFFENPKSLLQIISDLFHSKNDLWWRDPIPNFYQLSNIPVHYFKKWFR